MLSADKGHFFFNAFNDSNLDFLSRESIFKALAVNISGQRMDHSQGRHPDVSALSWGNTPIYIFTRHTLADDALGHMQCWAWEVQRCGSSLYAPGTQTARGSQTCEHTKDHIAS